MDLKHKIFNLNINIRQEKKQLWKNTKKDVNILYEKIKLHPLLCLFIIVSFYITYRSLFVLPQQQVSSFGINNATVAATLENQYRATMAQIIGGGAVLLTLYHAWENIKTTKDGQITDRYTRAIEQLGSDKSTIRVGGIYALERISDESKVYHWPIMEVLTEYIRENSSIYSTTEVNTGDKSTIDYVMKPDIQAIVSVIKRRNPKNIEEEKSKIILGHPFFLDLHGTCLQYADLQGAYLEEAKLFQANLRGANLFGADLSNADMRHAILDDAALEFTHLTAANLIGVSFVNTYIKECNFEFAKLTGANFEEHDLCRTYWDHADLENVNFVGTFLKNAQFAKTNLKKANFKNADLENANFEDAYLEEANLEEALNLSIEQLSKAKTLYNAKLRKEHETLLRKQYPKLFKNSTTKFERYNFIGKIHETE